MKADWFDITGYNRSQWGRPPVRLTGSINDWNSMSMLDMRWSYQLLSSEILKDPGYPIFLRNHDNSLLKRSWIYQPQEYCFRQALIKTRPVRRKPKVLLLIHHDIKKVDFEAIELRFASCEVYWTGYGLKQIPKLNNQKFIKPVGFLFEQLWRPEYFFDINWWKGDTLSPIHLSLLHNQIKCLNEMNTKDYVRKLDLGYGVFYFKR